MRQTAKWIGLLPMIVWTFMLTGCRSQSSITNISKLANTQLAPLAMPHTDITSLTAKTGITIDYDGKPITVKGRLRMRSDEVIQLSVTALGVVEVALIEFTPQGAYIIDRINKRYALLDYSSGLLNSVGVNFSTIQALFWNRIFIPGEKEVWKRLDNFRIVTTENRQLIEPKRQRLLKCHFYTDNEFEQLQQTQLNIQDYEVVWQYGIFNTIDTYVYPSIFDISFSDSSYSISAHITLSGVSVADAQWRGGTNLTNYKKVELEVLLSVLNLFS